MTARAACYAILAVSIAFVGGLLLGWMLPMDKPQKIEVNRPAVVHPSGAVTLERTQAEPPKPLPMPPQVSTRTRAVVLDLKPMEKPSSIQIDTTEGKDGTRITAEGPAILGGMDFTIPRPAPPKLHPWTFGAAWDGKSAGPFISYTWKRVTVGAYATKQNTAIFVGARF